MSYKQPKIEFTTASGKNIVVSEKAMEEAAKKMDYSVPEEDSLALSQNFLPPSISRSCERTLSNEVVVELPVDAIKITVKNVYSPAHRLLGKSYLVSDHAFHFIRKKATDQFRETEKPDVWTVSRQEMEKNSEKADDGEVAEADTIYKVTGIDKSGGFVRVFVSQKHGLVDFVIGCEYILCGFSRKTAGNVIELRSTDDILISPLNSSPSDIPFVTTLSVREILEKAKSTFSNIETDLVARITDVKPSKNGKGQTVYLRDAIGDNIKIKFVNAAEVDGVKEIIQEGNIIAATGLIIHYPITFKQHFLFHDEFTQYNTKESVPPHLKDAFLEMQRSDSEQMDCDAVKGAQKRINTPTDEATSSKKPCYE